MQEFNAMDPRSESVMRGMIAHSDERFQALSTRVASMEDSLVAMTNATRELRAAIARGATIQVEGGDVDTAGIAEIRDHLNELERHLADAFASQARRENEMVETLGARMHEETIRVSAETNQKVEALEATMKDAAGALGELVQAAAEQVERLGQATGEVSRGEVSLDSLNIDTGAMIDAFEERVVRLASLIRSDSTRIAEMIERGGENQRTELLQALDSRLGRVSELVSATTMSAVAEVAREVPEAAKSALEEKVGELIASMDQNFVQLADVNETEIHRMGRYLSERTAELVDAAIAGRLSTTLERITLAADAIEAAGIAGAGAEAGAGLGEAATADITVLIDDRITALAKMIRSDNTRLANVVEIAAQQEAAKQTTRAVKELAASLPAQIIDLMDRRFADLSESLHRETQSTVVAVAKAADVVSDRIVEVEERYESGVERAADKLGEAVLNAMSSRRD